MSPRPQDEDQARDEHESAVARQHDQARSEGRVHGEPPFEARPCRSLAGRRGPLQDLREVVGHVVLGVLVKPGGEVASEDVVRRHARRPSVASGR